MLGSIDSVAGVKMHSLCGHGGHKQQQTSHDQPASGWSGTSETNVLELH